MAGAGYKLFTTGSVLTAADVNTYLNEQSVMRFANAAARTTALASVLAEGMVSYLQDTDAVEVYNGTAWVSIGSSGDITAVTAGTGLSGGGTSGDVTLTNSMATTIDAKGDLIVGTADNSFSRLAVGTNNQVLTADSSTATGLKWAAAAGGGKVLQVITDTDSTEMSSSSSTYTDTNLSVTITPSSTSSKIMVFVYDTCQRNTTANAGVNYRLVRGSTTIVQLQNIMFSDAGEYHQGMIGIAYLDSPATTSATTYKTTFANNGQGTAQVHMQNNITAITVMEIGA